MPPARAATNASPAVVFARVTITPFTDADGDGLPDGSESRLGTDPANPDTDGDGLSDGAEAIHLNTDPLLFDSDGDLFGDGTEVAIGSDPMDPLSHPVTLSGTVTYGGAQTGAVWVVIGTNELDCLAPRHLVLAAPGDFDFTNLVSRRTWVAMAWLDVQADGLPALWEPRVASDPFAPTGNVAGVVLPLVDDDGDYDGNGLADRIEFQWFGRTGVDPAGDEDEDGLDNGDELAWRTDPLNPDTDGDGMRDGQEVDNGLDPLTPSPPIRLTIQLMGVQGALIRWNTVYSQGYRLQYRDDLTKGPWKNLLPSAIYEYDEYPEGAQQVLDRGAKTVPYRFYRVVTGE